MNQVFEPRGEWCLVANIQAEQPFGENREIRLGTKHFSPNTKVYCSAPIWGDGYEQIVVAGRHSSSKKLVTIAVMAGHL
jgi:hypothetical protein